MALKEQGITISPLVFRKPYSLSILTPANPSQNEYASLNMQGLISFPFKLQKPYL